MFLNNAFIPTLNGTFSFFSFLEGTTLSLVPANVIKNTIIYATSKTKNVLVHTDALFPKYSTKGNVSAFIIKLPQVANMILNILSTPLTYWPCVINEFKYPELTPRFPVRYYDHGFITDLYNTSDTGLIWTNTELKFNDFKISNISINSFICALGLFSVLG